MKKLPKRLANSVLRRTLHRLHTSRKRRLFDRARLVQTGVGIALACVLAACGRPASANGAAACQLVHRALSTFNTTPTPQGQGRALALLRQALPLAAVAAGSNGNWQPLEATLSETNRVAIATLRPALTIECQAGNAGNVYGTGVFTQASIPGTQSSGG